VIGIEISKILLPNFTIQKAIGKSREDCWNVDLCASVVFINNKKICLNIIICIGYKFLVTEFQQALIPSYFSLSHLRRHYQRGGDQKESERGEDQLLGSTEELANVASMNSPTPGISSTTGMNASVFIARLSHKP
jgi:hypothetical protein